MGIHDSRPYKHDTLPVDTHMRRRRILLALTTLLLGSCLCPILFVSYVFRLEVLSPWLCFHPTPPAGAVIHALRYGPGDGTIGVGDDGLVYRVRRLECSHQIGVATPKMTMQLQVYAGMTLVTQGQLRVGLIDDRRVVIFGYVPDAAVPATIQAKHPAVHSFLERYGR